MSNQITKEDVVKFIEGMTVLELSALVKELEEKFGVSAAAPMMAAVAAPGAAAAAPVEEQTEFNVILTGFGAEKIQVIKVGMLDSKLLTKGDLNILAELPSKEVLLGRLVSVMAAVPTSFVTVLSGVPRSFVQVLNAYCDKKKTLN